MVKELFGTGGNKTIADHFDRSFKYRHMKNVFSTLPCQRPVLRGALITLLIISGYTTSAQDLFTRAELVVLPQRVSYSSRSEDLAGQMHTPVLYTLFGNDFDGPNDFFLKFNLENRQTVRYEVVDVSGRLLGCESIPDVLDQTYKITLGGESTGIYIVRLMIDNRYYSEKILAKK